MSLCRQPWAGPRLTETELIGSLGSQQNDFENVLTLISSGSVKTTPLISGVIGLEEVVDVGYARMLEPDKEIFRLEWESSGYGIMHRRLQKLVNIFWQDNLYA